MRTALAQIVLSVGVIAGAALTPGTTIRIAPGTRGEMAMFLVKAFSLQ